MTEKVLLVDDDENILHGYHRVLRNAFEIEVAMGGAQALQALTRHGPYAVIVADMRMPGMSGLELLGEAQRIHGDTTRIMLTGNIDVQTVIDAVNQGRIFRFLTKPCPPEELAMAIRAGIRQYQLLRSERELLEQTLRGSIQVLSDLLATLDPAAFSLCQEVQSRCSQVAVRLDHQDVWEVEVAAMLAPIGRIALPPVLVAESTASRVPAPMLDRVPELGARLVGRIPRMAGVAEIIRHQRRGYDGSGVPAEGPEGEAIPLGARILRAVWDFTALETSRHSRNVALEELKLRAAPYDPRVLGVILETFTHPASQVAHVRRLALSDLRRGMVLAEPVSTGNGRQILPEGLRLGEGHLEFLRNLTGFMEVPNAISVLEP